MSNKKTRQTAKTNESTDDTVKCVLLSSVVEQVHNYQAEQFYSTIDPYLDAVDNTNILNDMITHHEAVSPYNSNASEIKQELLTIIADEQFMSYLLKKYNITVYEFFKILHRTYYDIFKGPYIKKIKIALQSTNYARKYM